MMKMRNFIIDASVFALPARSEDVNTEKDNLCTLMNNYLSLKILRKNDSITISYMNKILLLLRKNNLLHTRSQINSRIKELLAKMPECHEIDIDSPIFEDWDEFLFYKITPGNPIKNSATSNVRKGRIGIFNNIPDRDTDPDDNYITKTIKKGKKNVYPHLPQDFINTFKKYCGYMADLNQKYYCYENNFIVLGKNFQNMEKENVNITLNENGTYVQSCVAIVGIGKANTLCPPKIKFESLTDACNEAKENEDFSAKLDFGGEITNENIKKDLSSQAGPPEKIYGYLETLCQVTDIINNKNINITNDNTVIEMLNAYGLLCSYDDNKYSNYKCIYREFEDKMGNKLFFNVHLKPSTYTYIAPDEYDVNNENNAIGSKYASKYTVRVYLHWNSGEKKFIIGWIGHHPPFCKNCVNNKCQAK